LDEAAQLAETVINARTRVTHAQAQAAEMLLRVRGKVAAESVRQLLHWYQEVGCETWREARLRKIMAEAGVDYPSIEWATEMLSSEHRLPLSCTEIMEIWVTSQNFEGLTKIRSLIGDGSRLHPYDRADYAQILLDGGLPRDAFRAAELILRYPGARDSDYRKATDVLLKVDRGRGIESLAAQLEEMSTSAWGSGVLGVLVSDGTSDLDALSLQIANRILTLPDPDGLSVQTALDVITTLGGRDRLRSVAEITCRHSALEFAHQRLIAQRLASYGEEEAALSVWRYLLSVRGRYSDSSGIELLEDIAQALTFDIAKELVQEQLQAESPPMPFQRCRLKRMLAWLASSPARC
jgi:hypothetical protein